MTNTHSKMKPEPPRVYKSPRRSRETGNRETEDESEKVSTETPWRAQAQPGLDDSWPKSATDSMHF